MKINIIRRPAACACRLFPGLFLTVALVGLHACGEDDPADDSGSRPGAGTGSDMSVVASRAETPVLAGGNQLVAHWTLEGGQPVMTYCLEYDAAAGHSRWVAFRFDGVTRRTAVSRQYFAPQYPRDPQLPAASALPDCALYGSGYDHGHLCASADRLYSVNANKNTFYMTNMSPQRGNFNQGYWVTLEGRVQKLGRDALFADTLYVVKGGTVADGQTMGRVAGGRMVVPRYYYMALLRVRRGSYSSIGFLMEHKDYYDAEGRVIRSGNYATLEQMRRHAVSVDSLEKFTGIDFFHNLPDAVEQRVETLCDTTLWLGV